MQSTLFIPNKIKVGYVKRDDTYTKKLAYVIYYDSKGKLRKETSFEGWRDKSIPTDEFENKPHAGFTINKDVQRYSDWGSGRNMIRVYDDRGIEFEITCDNLIFILMNTDCLKRGLEGEFVYAWADKELLLLPTGCEEYTKSQSYTALQDKKISAKMMVPGCSYKTKSMENLIYLGRFMYYHVSRWEYERGRKDVKRHIFVTDDKNNYTRILSGLSSLCFQNTDVPVSNYAELLETFSKSKHASTIKEVIYEPIKDFVFPEPDLINGHNDGVDSNYKRIKPENNILYKKNNDTGCIERHRLNLVYNTFYSYESEFTTTEDYLKYHNNHPAAIKYVEDWKESYKNYPNAKFYAYKYPFKTYELIHTDNIVDINTIPKKRYINNDVRKDIKKADFKLSDYSKISFVTENGATIPLEQYV